MKIIYKKGSGFLLLLSGLIITGLGISFLDSISERVSRVLEGTHPETALWLLIGGAAAIMAGAIFISEK